MNIQKSAFLSLSKYSNVHRLYIRGFTANGLIQNNYKHSHATLHRGHKTMRGLQNPLRAAVCTLFYFNITKDYIECLLVKKNPCEHGSSSAPLMF